MRELRIAGLDLLKDPFSTERHVRFAEALADLGILGAARLHLEQAVALSDHAEAAQEQLRALLARDDYAEQGEVYFASFSDATPPYRQSRETGGYNRKDEQTG